MTDEQQKPDVVETVLVSGYQHFNNGGVTTELIKRVSSFTDSSGNLQTHLTLRLRTSVSNMGFSHVSDSPLFSTSAPVLHAIAAAIEDNQHMLDPEYLAPINLELQFPVDGHTIQMRGPSGERHSPEIVASGDSLYGGFDGDGEESVDEDEDLSAPIFDLDKILEEYKIAIFSQDDIWTADVYDGPDDVPTRTGHGPTVRQAVEQALAQPVNG